MSTVVSSPAFGWNREELRHIALLEDSDDYASRPEREVVLGAIRRARQRALSLLRKGFERQASGDRAPIADPPPLAARAILLKPVGDLCNLRCTYCYEGAGPDRLEQSRMSEATLEAILRDVLAQNTGIVQFLWHGGEPLMAGLPFFRAGMRLEQQHNVNRCRIVNTVQTNGLLLNQQWIDFFREHAFNVGISVDGPQDLHDRFRINACGQGTFSGVSKAIRQLQDNGFDVGAISVISAALAVRADDVFSNFRALGVTAYDVHPDFSKLASLPDLANQPLDPALFSTFVNRLFDLWLASGDRDIRIGIFDDFFQGMIGHAPSSCYFSGNCSSIVGFEANGDAVPCTRPFDRSRYTFGNIGDTPLTTIQAGSSFQQFLHEDLAGQANSRSCRWYKICHDGCPQHRMKDGKQSVDGANLYCECQSGKRGGYSAIFDHALRRSEEVLGLGRMAWQSAAPSQA